MTLHAEQMSEEEYNELPGLRSTALKYKIRYGNRAFFQKYESGLFGQHDEKDECRFGNVFHGALIEQKKDWIVWDGGRRASKDWEAFKLYANAVGKFILLPKEEEKLAIMLDSVANNKDAMDLLSRTVRKEQVIQFEYKGMPCKIRLDMWLDDDGQVDAKTSQDASEEGFFFKGIDRFRYDIQSEFYKLGVQYYLETDRDLPFSFIVVENKEPYRCAVHKIHYTVAELAREKMFTAMDDLVECYDSGIWREPLAEDEDGERVIQCYSPSLYWLEKNGATFDDGSYAN